MSAQVQNVNFSLNFLIHPELLDFGFVQYLDGYLMTSHCMSGELHLNFAR